MDSIVEYTSKEHSCSCTFNRTPLHIESRLLFLSCRDRSYTNYQERRSSCPCTGSKTFYRPYQSDLLVKLEETLTKSHRTSPNSQTLRKNSGYIPLVTYLTGPTLSDRYIERNTVHALSPVYSLSFRPTYRAFPIRRKRLALEPRLQKRAGIAEFAQILQGSTRT